MAHFWGGLGMCWWQRTQGAFPKEDWLLENREVCDTWGTKTTGPAYVRDLQTILQLWSFLLSETQVSSRRMWSSGNFAEPGVSCENQGSPSSQGPCEDNWAPHLTASEATCIGALVEWGKGIWWLWTLCLVTCHLFAAATGGLWPSWPLWFFSSFSASWLRSSWGVTESLKLFLTVFMGSHLFPLCLSWNVLPKS